METPQKTFLESVRAAYLGKRSGWIQVDGQDEPERLFLIKGELFLDREHPEAGELLQIHGARSADEATDLQRFGKELAHFYVRIADNPATFHMGAPDPAPDLVGPAPTVFFALELAVFGCEASQLAKRLGGPESRYNSSSQTPAVRQLPSLEAEMAEVLPRLEGPTSIASLLRGGRDELSVLRGLARLYAVGLVVREGEKVDQTEVAGDIHLVAPKVLERFSDRIFDSLRSDPVELAAERHREMVAQLLARFGEMNHYELLDISTSASVDDVHRAYQSLARLVHPRHAEAIGLKGREATLQILFERATQAYLTLTDPKRRSSYNILFGIRTQEPVSAEQRASEKQTMARELFLRGQQSLQRKDFSTAVDLLTEAARIEPQAEHFALLGTALAKNPNWLERAEKNLRRAVQMAPSDAKIRIAFGALLEDMGRIGEAHEQYQSAVALAPENPDANEGLKRISSALQETKPLGRLGRILGK